MSLPFTSSFLILSPIQQHYWPLQLILSFDELHSSYNTFQSLLPFPIHTVFISHRTCKTCNFISIRHDHQPYTQQFSDNSRLSSLRGRRVRYYRRGGFIAANMAHGKPFESGERIVRKTQRYYGYVIERHGYVLITPVLRYLK